MNVQTKIFRSGNSDALRLPRNLSFGVGTEVAIERDGDRLIVTPIAKRKLSVEEMIEKLRSLPRPSTPTLREPFEYPDRPGLFD